MRTADCAPVVLLTPSAVGVVHVGWRGLMAGVLEAAVAALGDLHGATPVAHLGPCIRVGCYEFDGPERADVVARHPEAGGTTGWGTPALDLPAGVHAALRDLGIIDVHDVTGCTACDQRWFSHRARGEAERFATTVWLDEA